MDEPLWPEHQPGSTPEAHTRQDRRKVRGSDIVYNIIDDPRVAFARRAGESLGGRWDNDNRELVFDGSNQNGFEQTKAVVAKMPYYEVPRSQARFANAEVKGLGVAFVKRPMFEQRGNQASSASVWLVMAPDKATHLEAVTIAFQKSRATAEQTASINEALASGKLTDAMIADRLGDDTRAVPGSPQLNDSEDLAFAMSAEQLSIPAANKLIGSFLPIKEYERGDALVKQIKEYIKEGRLTEQNSGGFPLDDASLDYLTVEQGYDLQRLGKRSIGAKQRFELQKMVDVGALQKYELRGLDKMTWQDYMATRQRAKAYMSDEVEAEFDAIMQGYAEPRQSISNGRKNDSGRYDRPVTEEEYRTNSRLDITEAVATVRDKGFKQGEPHLKGIDALMVEAASRYHLLATDDKKTFFVIERSGKDAESPFIYTAGVTSALAEDRDGDSLTGKIITISGNDKRFVNLSDQETISGARCEAQARLLLMDRGLRDAPNLTQAPENGIEGVVQARDGGYVSVLGQDKKLYTVPIGSVSNQNPTLFDEVHISPENAPALAQALTANVATKKTRAAAGATR
jgi:hypothetical protein